MQPATGKKTPKGMLIGYARVSTGDQTLDLQEDELRAAGCERIFTDVASGSRSARPGLDEALDHLRRGDTLVVGGWTGSGGPWRT